ncbi:hypothetical protein HZA57_05050 [Candidatus Poribacteria bacterium]|nr:hypothetical protein [Candidatus Poribacteria bacterium]
MAGCAVATLAVATPATSRAGPGERDSYWCIGIDMSDSEGHAGLGTGPIWPDNSRNEVIVGDFRYEFPGWYGCGSTDVPALTPILFRASSPLSETFAGYSTTGHVGYATFLVPVPASQVPYGLSERDVSSEYPPGDVGHMWFQIQLFVADVDCNASLALDWSLTSTTWSLPVTITAEYLEGNVLASKRREVGVIPGRAPYDFVQALWVQREEHDPNEFIFGKVAPAGPMRLSVSVEGYTTDTITLVAEDLRWYTWYARVSPSSKQAPGLSASELLSSLIPLPPPEDVIERALLWKLDGTAIHSSNIEPFLDVTGDGVGDVADLIARHAARRAASRTDVPEQLFDETRRTR